MSFRDVEFDQNSVDRRVKNVSGKVESQGLPSGFSWKVVEIEDGSKTLVIVETSTDRVVMQGY